VFRKTNQELTAFLSNDEVARGRTFYMKLVRSMVNVHLRQMVTMADQPERHGILCVAGGNGTYGGRWGFSANLVALWVVLVPCSSCRANMFKELDTKPYERVWDDTVCDKCTRWEIDIDTPLLDVPVDEKKFAKNTFPTGIIRPHRYVPDVLPQLT